MEISYSCPMCPVQLPAAKPATVQLQPDGSTWTELPTPTPVHLVALFREPGIRDERVVSTILDLRVREDGSLAAGRRCWVKPFLKALPSLPPGLVVALDNGVRCPCPKKLGECEYNKRTRHCVAQTQRWLEALVHPDGGSPGLLFCDRDLACAYSGLGLLRRQNNQDWQLPSRFVDAVGEEVIFVDGKTIYNGLILAHPVLFRGKHARTYADAFQRKGLVRQVVALSRIGGP